MSARPGTDLTEEALPYTETAQKVLGKLQKLEPYQTFREQIADEPFGEEE